MYMSRAITEVELLYICVSQDCFLAVRGLGPGEGRKIDGPAGSGPRPHHLNFARLVIRIKGPSIL